jgi:hypothetical protein
LTEPDLIAEILEGDAFIIRGKSDVEYNTTNGE